MAVGGQVWAADAVSPQQLQDLQDQNKALQQQLREQKALLESLTQKVKNLEKGDHSGSQSSSSDSEVPSDVSSPKTIGSTLGQVKIGAEGGVMFWASGSDGVAPDGEFRLDEARLFVESPVVDNVYAYIELNLATREEPDVQVRLGEAYIDFENLLQRWGYGRLLNARAGRIYTPFGEEYQTRYAIDNPLITHSLADLWSVDEGVELYGTAGRFCYATAVQNGGVPDTQDFTSDKTVALRVGYDPAHWFHASVSAMRTGDLDVQGDFLSAMWFGNGFFRSIGSPATTKFHANLLEGDVVFRLPHGRIHAFGGYVYYNDNDPAANNHRNVFYYSVEATQNLGRKFYVATRFSQILAPNGFPIAGDGDFGEYFFGPLTSQIWRLSLGLGYRFSDNLLFKAEYCFERGKTVTGESRDHEDLFAVEAAFRF